MATFTPCNNKRTESIVVDFKDRHTAQKVILCNRENLFYGRFIGVLSANEIDVRSGILSNVTLYNAVIRDSSGNEVVLSDINENINEFKELLSSFQLSVLPGLSDDIHTLSGHVEDWILSVYEISSEMSQRIGIETDERFDADRRLFNNISTVSDNLNTLCVDINTRLDEHIQDQAVELQNLSSNLSKEIGSKSHYDLVNVSESLSENGVVYELSDFAANYIDASTIYANVRSQRYNKHVGFIKDVSLKNDEVTSFTLVFLDRPLFPQIVLSTYDFSIEYKEIETGYYTYKLSWDGDNPDDEFKTILIPDVNTPYLSAYTDDCGIGRILAFEPKSDTEVDRITSGQLKFVIEESSPISAFNDLEPFDFSITATTKTYENDGIVRKAIFDYDNQRIILRDNYTAVMFQSLSADQELGRIYEDQVTYKPRPTPTSRFSVDSLSVVWFVDGDGRVLELVSDGEPERAYVEDDKYVTFMSDDSDSFVRYCDRKEYFGTHLRKYNIREHQIEGDDLGYIQINNVNLSSINDPSITSFTVSISSYGCPIPHGDYMLSKNESTESETNIYTYSGTIPDSSDKLILTYDFRIPNFIRYTVESETISIGYLKLDTLESESLVVTTDSTEFINSFHLTTDDYGKIYTGTEDPRDTVDYIVHYDTTVSIYNPDDGDEFDSMEPMNEISVKIPDIQSTSKSREFIIVLDNPKEYRPVSLKFAYEDDVQYKFFLNGKDITDGLDLHDSKVSLKFTEIRYGVFVIDEMSNTDFINVQNISAFNGNIDNLTVKDNAYISDLDVETLSVKTLSVEDGMVESLTAQQISAANLTAVNANVSTENVLTSRISNLNVENGKFTSLSGTSLTAVDETVTNLTASNASVTNGLTAMNLSASNLTAVNSYISSQYVLTSNIHELNADKIGVNLSDLMLSNGNNVSSAYDISADFKSSLNSIGDSHNELSGRFDKTLTPSAEEITTIDPDKVPEFLMLKDQDLTGVVYVLQVRSGRLAIKQIYGPQIDG